MFLQAVVKDSEDARVRACLLGSLENLRKELAVTIHSTDGRIVDRQRILASNVNKLSPGTNTPLIHLVCSRGQTELAFLLLNHGANNYDMKNEVFFAALRIFCTIG